MSLLCAHVIGLLDTGREIFPPFPIPGFTPNFTGYNWDQWDIDWYHMYMAVSPKDWLVDVRNFC